MLGLQTLRLNYELCCNKGKCFNRIRTPLVLVGTIALWIFSARNQAIADRITIDGVQHSDVLISSGESQYYVSFPKLGTTISVRKSDVSDEEVLIETTGEERSALFAVWKSANSRLKEQREEEKARKESEAEEKRRLKDS